MRALCCRLLVQHGAGSVARTRRNVGAAGAADAGPMGARRRRVKSMWLNGAG